MHIISIFSHFYAGSMFRISRLNVAQICASLPGNPFSDVVYIFLSVVTHIEIIKDACNNVK